MKRTLYLLIVCSGLLLGCSSSSSDDVHSWMIQSLNETKPHVTPIVKPKKFIPEPFVNSTDSEPFSNLKLAQSLKTEATKTISNSALIAPEIARRKESLESYPLDSMEMVGSILKDDDTVALVKISSLLYQIKKGQHIGMNFGRVSSISETEVTLQEIFQDATGEWTSRVATLQLQEKSK